MKSGILTCSLLIAGLLIAGAGPVIAQDTKGEATGEQEMMEMMELMAKYGQPGPFHHKFQKLAGKWTASAKMWLAPETQPAVSTGKVEFELILGGRYLVQRFEGQMMDATHRGMGITAYDNFRERFIDIWIDDMNTGIVVSYGTADSTGQIITYHSKMDDPMTGRKDVPVRTITTFVDDDTHLLEMFATDPAGQEFQTMEILYKRQK